MTISRRKFQVGSALLGLFLVYWLWPGRSWSYINLPPPADGPWAAFGDSLTQGYGADAGADYPAQLALRLGVSIQNFGVAGETSADGLKRIEEVEALNPRVVLLCFGGNDVLQGLPSDRMFANIGAAIDRFQARGSFVVLLGIRGASLVGDANADGFKKLAEQKQVKFVPNILENIFSRPSLMSDYVHPNNAGYAAIAERIEKELRPLLPKLMTPHASRP
jgi:acyl-CoA thioesterase-1